MMDYREALEQIVSVKNMYCDHHVNVPKIVYQLAEIAEEALAVLSVNSADTAESDPETVIDELGQHDAARKLVMALGYTWVGGEWSTDTAGAKPKPVASGWLDPKTGSVALTAKAGTEGWERVPLYLDAPPAPSVADAQVDNLSALVVRLARALRKASPDSDLPTKALDYLYRKDLVPSVLRGVISEEINAIAPSVGDAHWMPEMVAAVREDAHRLHAKLKPGTMLNDDGSVADAAGASDAERYRWIATLRDWSDIERMCWSSTAKSAAQFKSDLDKYIDAAIAKESGND